MKLLLFVLLVCAIAALPLLQPSSRNRALAKITALAGVLALLWPVQMAYAIAAPAVLMALWGLWRLVFWPLYWLDGERRR